MEFNKYLKAWITTWKSILAFPFRKYKILSPISSTNRSLLSSPGDNQIFRLNFWTINHTIINQKATTRDTKDLDTAQMGGTLTISPIRLNATKTHWWMISKLKLSRVFFLSKNSRKRSKKFNTHQGIKDILLITLRNMLDGTR